MIHLEFSLFSKKYSKKELLKQYTLDYLNDWLSHESEIKYLFYFENIIDESQRNIPKYLDEPMSILKYSNLLNNEEKQYILSIYIEDAYVYEKDNIAYFNIKIKSEYLKQEPNEKIIKYICNHIYNYTELGVLKNGIIQPLNEIEKKKLNWLDEIGWSYKIIENKEYSIDEFDFLMLSDFTYLYKKTDVIKNLSKPIYISNYNLECNQIAKSIEQINVDIHRYKKSIHFLKKKKEELKEVKKHLYKNYKIAYINMLSNNNKIWNERETI